MTKPSFKEWYEKKYGSYPGSEGELYTVIFSRLADAMAVYVDETVKDCKPDLGER